LTKAWVQRLREVWLAFAIWLHVSPVAAFIILVLIVMLIIAFLTAITAACYASLWLVAALGCKPAGRVVRERPQVGRFCGPAAALSILP